MHRYCRRVRPQCVLQRILVHTIQFGNGRGSYRLSVNFDFQFTGNRFAQHRDEDTVFDRYFFDSRHAGGLARTSA